MGLFDSSNFKLTPSQAEWVLHRVIGDAGYVGHLMHEFMNPYDKRHLFDCLYGQGKKSFALYGPASENWWSSEQRARLSEEIEPYVREERIWETYRRGDFNRIRAAIDRIEAEVLPSRGESS